MKKIILTVLTFAMFGGTAFAEKQVDPQIANLQQQYREASDLATSLAGTRRFIERYIKNDSPVGQSVERYKNEIFLSGLGLIVVSRIFYKVKGAAIATGVGVITDLQVAQTVMLDRVFDGIDGTVLIKKLDGMSHAEILEVLAQTKVQQTAAYQKKESIEKQLGL